MKVTIFTAFPEYFIPFLQSAIIKRAVKNELLLVNIVNIRNYGLTNYQKIDDTPYGGGAGMILRADVLERAIEDNIDHKSFLKNKKKCFFITSPRGLKFSQKKANQFSKYEEIAILCNRYEGVDQRAIDYYKMKEVSIGDYILMGGEVAAVAILEATTRLINGVLKNEESSKTESFSQDFTKEHDQYTKPEFWKDISVPRVLISGNHKLIEEWKRDNSKVSKRKANK